MTVETRRLYLQRLRTEDIVYRLRFKLFLSVLSLALIVIMGLRNTPAEVKDVIVDPTLIFIVFPFLYIREGYRSVKNDWF